MLPYTLVHGDSKEALKGLADASIDAVVCDPPYELGFMGKKWDATGIAYNVELWKECFRVLKPGGHLLAFGGTRTYHRMAVAIEDAGFEVRDMLEWIYASGFPKSLNIGKAVDKLQGNERELVGEREVPDIRGDAYGTMNDKQGGSYKNLKIQETKGNSEWEGFGTALKPAHEPIIMARKPLSEKTIVENVLKHGTGALDIDGCRIPTSDNEPDKRVGTDFVSRGGDASNNANDNQVPNKHYVQMYKDEGRFPANIICTDDALNDGVMTKSGFKDPNKVYSGEHDIYGKYGDVASASFHDSGSKSRYFDIDVWAEKHGLLQFPKASKRERNEGCEGLEKKTASECCEDRREGSAGLNNPRAGAGITSGGQNHHPTVKPVHLMSWLVRLVSKEGDTVLDPFMGSGTTGVATIQLNRKFVGIERDSEYINIARSRIEHVMKLPPKLIT